MAKDKQQQEDLTKRSAEAVFEDHLKLAIERDMEAELSRNNAEEIVLLTNFGVFHGHQGVREAAELLEKELPNGTFNYKVKLCHDNICYLHWTGDSEEASIEDGADSYLIENGRIKIQTIYYTVKKKQ